MPFALVWTAQARETFEQLQAAAQASIEKRTTVGKTKVAKPPGLFKQFVKCVELLAANPRHPGLQTQEYTSIENPYDKNAKVFEAYVQQRTPGAYRVFWCYGPQKGEITIIAITPHP
ncbi:MAG TPA: hypothetical protein VGM03_17030 [Phycisphaerae bacterium]|jgi:hypothetical protein